MPALNIKVRPMESPRTGAPVTNQYLITDGDRYIFQSYSSIIAVIDYGKGGQVTLDRDKWDYSVTTSKYRNEFLGERTAETRKKIEDGTYLLGDLN